jgi:hypothetical protein
MNELREDERSIRRAQAEGASKWPALLCALALSGPGAVLAQDDERYVPEKVESKKKEDEEAQGWLPALSVGANVNISSNSNVVGQPDGTSFTLGFNLKGALDYVRDKHEFQNSLTITETFTRTPVVSAFVNTTDNLTLQDIYYYRLEPWVGPFASNDLETSLFPGFDVRPDQRDYIVTSPDGTTTTVTSDRLQLREPLLPLLLKQSVGFFARPLRKKWLRLEVRAGGGAREVFADGQFALADDGGTEAIEVNALRNYAQIGAEANFLARGAVSEGRVTYEASASFMTPLYNSVSTADRGPLELTNIELLGKISFKLVEWASLDYEVRAIRRPLLLDRFQLQNNLLLTFGYTFIEPEKKGGGDGGS